MPFCCFEAFLGGNLRELFFLDIKVTIAETSTKILRKFVFLTNFERTNPEENLDLFKQLFLNKPVIEDKY